MFSGNARDIPTVSLAGKKKKLPSKEELAEKSNRDRKQRVIIKVENLYQADSVCRS
jgi:hypothetical protein